MKFIKIAVVCILWIMFVTSLLVGLEIFARHKLHYKVRSLNLEGINNNFTQLDKVKKYNEKFVKEGMMYFKNWPTQLDTFEDTDTFPRYLYKPNIKLSKENGELIPSKDGNEVYWSTNSYGFRGKEFTVEKSAGVTRIVALGASTTEGQQKDDQTYPVYLEKILKERGCNCEVINAGFHAFGVSDILAIFKDKVVPLDPDMVIYYEMANNIYPYSFLSEKWGGWNSWETAYGPFFTFFRHHSALFVFFTKSYEEKEPPIRGGSFSAKLAQRTVKEHQDKVREIVDLGKNNDVKVVLTTFVTVANENFRVDRKEKPGLWGDVYLKWYPFTPSEIGQAYEAYNDSFRDLANYTNSKLIDLSKQFPKDVNYFMDHFHFESKGNELLAKIIADNLEDVLSFDDKF